MGNSINMHVKLVHIFHLKARHGYVGGKNQTVVLGEKKEKRVTWYEVLKAYEEGGERL